MRLKMEATQVVNESAITVYSAHFLRCKKMMRKKPIFLVLVREHGQKSEERQENVKNGAMSLRPEPRIFFYPILSPIRRSAKQPSQQLRLLA